jgi:hypothetical protein
MVRRVSKTGRSGFTHDAIAAFAAAMPLREHREKQLHNSDACPGIGHCAVCDEYEDHVATIATALGLAPHERNPIDAFDALHPPWLDETAAMDWEKARGIHVELAAAAGIPPVTTIPTWDLSRPRTMLRWIERSTRIPEGPGVGANRARVRQRGGI